MDKTSKSPATGEFMMMTHCADGLEAVWPTLGSLSSSYEEFTRKISDSHARDTKYRSKLEQLTAEMRGMNFSRTAYSSPFSIT